MRKISTILALALTLMLVPAAFTGDVFGTGYEPDECLRTRQYTENALLIAWEYLDNSPRTITTEYCDDLCQAEREVARIKHKREDMYFIKGVVNGIKLRGGTK